MFNHPTIFPFLISTLSISIELNPKLALARLYCVGSLSNIYLSFLSAGNLLFILLHSFHLINLNLESQPDLSLLNDIRQKMQQVLLVVLSLLTVGDEVFLTITSSSIDTPTNGTETQDTSLLKESNDEENTTNDMEGLKKDDGESEDKFVFLGGDVDRSWTEHFDVVEVSDSFNNLVT